VTVREISTATDQTVSFFHALAPPLVAIALWLMVMVFFLMLYGLYTWGIYPFKKS
jgi:hypothetical protein